jgi:hypothetical protein
MPEDEAGKMPALPPQDGASETFLLILGLGRMLEGEQQDRRRAER